MHYIYIIHCLTTVSGVVQLNVKPIGLELEAVLEARS